MLLGQTWHLTKINQQILSTNKVLLDHPIPHHQEDQERSTYNTKQNGWGALPIRT